MLEFVGEYAMLNPAYHRPVKFEGVVYPSIMHAVEASKFPPERRQAFTNQAGNVLKLGSARDYTPAQVALLEKCLRARFKEGTEFHKVLMSTGQEPLVYYNQMHRNWYGACTCPECMGVVKHDHVGKILAAIRDGK